MHRHLKYAKYIIRHKYYVFLAGIKTGAPLYRLIIHDWSKLLPSEWGPYARTFYAPNGANQYKPDERFHQAWNLHQKRNKHHWQYWVMMMDNNAESIKLQIPDKYIREMIADWAGAGRAITGEWEVKTWYNKKKESILLHPESRKKLEEILYECF